MTCKTSISLQSLQLLKGDLLNYTKWNLVAKLIHIPVCGTSPLR